MNDFSTNFEFLKNITIDKEFENICPALSDEEFETLEGNILEDGEVTSPIYIWNNILIDGHHRRKIILNYPKIPFAIKNRHFENRDEAIAWICKNQIGRRNLTPEQFKYLIGKQYEAEKRTWGASDGFRGNKYDVLVSGTACHLQKQDKTSEKIAKENKVSERFVREAEQWAKGVDAAENVCPGIKTELLCGALKPAKAEVIALGKMSAEEIPKAVSEIRKDQTKREEKRRRAKEAKRKKPDKAKETEKAFSNISELSANMAEPKPRNNISNVLGIISDSAQTLQATCESYIEEFPELEGSEKPQLLRELSSLRDYLNKLFKEI